MRRFIDRHKPDGMSDPEFLVMLVIFPICLVYVGSILWTSLQSGVWLGPPLAAIGYMAWRALHR